MLTLPNSSSAQSTRHARHQPLRSVWCRFGVQFSAGSALAPSNDNSSKPDPDPNQGALAVPANDNGTGSSLPAAIANWGVILAAGTVVVAANFGYLPQPRLPTVPRCTPAATAAVAVRITPDTLISTLTDVQFDDMIKAMKRQEGTGPRTLSFRAHNPGDVNIGNWARKHGAVSDIHGIAVFKTESDGERAMKDLIKEVYGHRSIYGMLAGDPEHGVKGYAPKVRDQFGNVGNPALYAEHVATWMSEMAAERIGGPDGACHVSSKPPKHPDRKPKSQVALPRGATASIDAPSSGSAQQTVIPVQHHGR